MILAHLHPSAGNEPSGGGRHCQRAKTCFRWADVVFGPMGADGADVVFTETPKSSDPLNFNKMIMSATCEATEALIMVM